MSDAAATPRMELLVRRLVLLAGDVHDLLACGDWSAALPVQEEFDESFAALQQHVERGAVLDRSLLGDLQRLATLNVENQQLAADLQSSASERVRSISSVRTVARAYAPLGANHRPTPRYVDGSA
jgi:hypothetical protein